ERRTVMKLHATAQRDPQLRGRNLRPTAGEHGLGLERAAVVVHERLVNGSVPAIGQCIVLGMDVPCGDVAGAGPLERLGMQASGSQCQCGTQDSHPQVRLAQFHWLTPKLKMNIPTLCNKRSCARSGLTRSESHAPQQSVAQASFASVAFEFLMAGKTP